MTNNLISHDWEGAEWRFEPSPPGSVGRVGLLVDQRACAHWLWPECLIFFNITLFILGCAGFSLLLAPFFSCGEWGLL